MTNNFQSINDRFDAVKKAVARRAGEDRVAREKFRQISRTVLDLAADEVEQGLDGHAAIARGGVDEFGRVTFACAPHRNSTQVPAMITFDLVLPDSGEPQLVLVESGIEEAGKRVDFDRLPLDATRDDVVDAILKWVSERVLALQE
jgi:hypothetical protein